MKTNYTLKTIKTGLAIFAMVFSFTFASAQVATQYKFNLRIAQSIYPAGPVTMISDEIALEGTTFKIQAIVTPSSTAGSSFIESNANRRWGVDNSTIDGNLGETAVIDAISIVDFNDNGTGYTVGAISNLHFDAITLRGVNGANDDPRITVDGATNPGTFDLGQAVNTTETITFGVAWENAATTSYTVGGTDDVTSITLTTATTNFQNSYQVIGVDTAYVFTTDPNLSVEDVVKKGALAIYPTVVENTFTVNKAFETLQLFDITGKTVKTFNASDNLEVSGLRSGLYIVKIQSEVGGIATGKLIVK